MLYISIFILGLIVGTISSMVMNIITQRRNVVGKLIIFHTAKEGDYLGMKIYRDPNALLGKKYVTVKMENSQE